MRIFLLLALSIIFIGCTNKYDEYHKVPDYITEASGSDKAYFDAYDETLKLWDVSYEELYIPTTNGIAHVIVSGPENTEPIVLLHGMNASATMWYPNIEALSKNHRVFAIDLILEPGKSHMYNEIEGMDEVIDWYQEVLFVLDLEAFHIIGASKGGWMAVSLALDHSAKIKSLILLSPAQTFTWIRPSTDVFKNVVALLYSEEKQIAKSLETLSSRPSHISDIYLEQYRIGLSQNMKNRFMASMKPFSNDELRSLQMPVLVLIGDDDMINADKTIEIANTLPNGTGEVIRNSGHFLSIDQAETVNEKMLSFLASQ
ncbi:alpha/beta hydrolase [Aggregatimonas sangjinii]|uniref:Alpha/beta hydrolase n=1 Tax=Aggregatimonas sangjinii TaxID=2583587 RepID=A0A5B7SMZ9_9FLAO|nr:alpha/beta hydrolase [Aggregatimonas sangjinii]QCW99935.1 alpha/beta hydrolase [Aggregatimonas sangjinii]